MESDLLQDQNLVIIIIVAVNWCLLVLIYLCFKPDHLFSRFDKVDSRLKEVHDRLGHIDKRISDIERNKVKRLVK